MSTMSTSSGWNRGTSTPKPPPKKPSALRGVIAGGIVVILAAIVYFAFFSGDDAQAPSTNHQAPSTIREVRPAAAPTNAAPARAAKPKRVPKTYIDEKGVERYEGGLRVVKHWPKPPAEQMNTNPHLFENKAEFELLGLITTEPGTFILDIDYRRRDFEPAFLEALKHKIEILPEDSEEVREQKLAVIDAKKTLEEAYKRGEDVTQIMNESRRELVRLNRYREQLIATASEKLSKDGTTDKDLGEWVDAMNAMLRDNGITEIKQKELARDILRYQRRTAALKAKEAAAKAEAKAEPLKTNKENSK